MRTHFGYLARVLHWCTDQTMSATLAQMDLTAAQGRIVGYIANVPEAPCSRDIETHFQLSHPTVSGILSRLEKKEFIEFFPDPQDRRCKRIRLLEKGRECHTLIRAAIAKNEARMVEGFTEAEQAAFHALLERAVLNMGGNTRCLHKKEE